MSGKNRKIMSTISLNSQLPEMEGGGGGICNFPFLIFW